MITGLNRRRRVAPLVGAVLLAVSGASMGAATPRDAETRREGRSALSSAVVAHAAAPSTCPTRPRFNSVIDPGNRTSFFYRPQAGQVIVGARAMGTARVRTLLTTASGRARLPRVEITTDRIVDARRLPWFARKVGPRRVIAVILSTANSHAYAGIRLGVSPKVGTAAKLILPSGTVRTTAAGCPRVTGYRTIYGQNIRRGATPRPTPAPATQPPPATPTIDVGPALRLVLAVPRDQQAPSGATDAIRTEANEVTAWFGRQFANGAGPRWIRTPGGEIDVRVVPLPKTAAEYSEQGARAVLDDVRTAARPTQGTVVDVVWIDAGGGAESQACGVSRTGRDGQVVRPMGSVLWQAACGIVPDSASTWPYGGTYLLAHEMTHLLGGAGACAPHDDGSGHVTDSPMDIISGVGRDWSNLRLDPGYDDYLFTGTACDIVHSPLWTVTPTRPVG